MESNSRRLADAAAVLSFAVGGAAFVVAAGIVTLPVFSWVGVAVPGAYRLFLVGVGVVGGAVHLLAGWWIHQRRSLFRVAFTTLAGMVLLQVSVPLDVVVLGLCWVARDEFGEE